VTCAPRAAAAHSVAAMALPLGVSDNGTVATISIDCFALRISNTARWSISAALAGTTGAAATRFRVRSSPCAKSRAWARSL